VGVQAQSKVLGPFEVIQEVGAVGRALVSVPYTEVRGSQLVVQVIDNFAKVEPASSFDPQFWAAAEVQINGAVQGFEFCLKRQHTRMLTGPMGYVVPDEAALDQLVFRARNMTGGRRGPPGSGETDATAANGYSIKVQIHIQPRGGIGPSQRFEVMG
jgi:hypothetical protein